MAHTTKDSLVEVPGSYSFEWKQKYGMPSPFMYKVHVQHLGGRKKRTLSIMGKIRNLPSVRDGSTAIPDRSLFHHGGHLIAARFGGPTRRRNIVPMYGFINMTGGTWYRLEEHISRLLEDEQGTMLVEVHYEGPHDTVPASFMVKVATPSGKRLTQKVQNGNPLLLPLTHPERWRMHILCQLGMMTEFTLHKSVRDRILNCDSLTQLKKWSERVSWINDPEQLFDPGN